MGVRNGENLENPLQGPILARPTMKRVEGDFGLEASEHGRNVAPHIDLGYAMPEPLHRLGAVLAGPQRDFSLGRPPSHENGDMLAHGAQSRRPMRLISHSSSTPELSFTRARTVSPRSSISAAEAPPRLIRKLQCSSET